MIANDTVSEQIIVYTVSELNLAVRAILDEAFDTLWIRGEISNFTCPRSGHWYFTLKDANAQVRCAMFKGSNFKVGFIPENGFEVIVRAKAGLYPERGEYQLIVDHLESAGEGELRRAFEILKNKLIAAGYFEGRYKKNIPAFSQRIGIITSPTGAALQDILSVLKRRFPLMEVYVYPCMVQGHEAPPTIVKSIKWANQHNHCDLLILARGGGSLEDLWAFNEESVAKAIFESKIPIISGVGHEIDFTIADFVADLRAPTPSAAAEAASPDQETLMVLFGQRERQLHVKINQFLQNQQQTLDYLEKRLPHPLDKLQQQVVGLESLCERLHFAKSLYIKQLNQKILFFKQRLSLKLLEEKIQLKKQTTVQVEKNLHQSFKNIYQTLSNNFRMQLQALDTVNPLATLKRGYSITSDSNNQIITTTCQVKVGSAIQTQLADGILESVVTEVP